MRPKRADYRPERVDLRHEGTDFWPYRADFRVERPDGGTDRLNNRWTNKSPPVFYRTLSPSGRCPKIRAICGQRYPSPCFVCLNVCMYVCMLEWEEAGQRPQRGQSPVERRGTRLSICPSVRWLVPPGRCPAQPIILSRALATTPCPCAILG